MSRIIEAMDFESDDKNWKFDFKVMCKKYGKDFISILKVMWEVDDNINSEKEFCELNNINEQFFNKVIKNKS
jgi:hypothetical protein